MWHPSWGGYATSGYPHHTTSGDLPGQPMGAFNGGGFIPQGSPGVPHLPQSAPPGQWSHPGQAMWQPSSSTTPLGNFSGSPTALTTGPPTFQGCSPVTFRPAAPLETTNLQAPGPTMPSTSIGNALPGFDPGPFGLMGPQHNTHPALPPQSAEHQPVLPSAPPTSSAEIDFKALGDRLDAAFTEKLETIAQTLQASWNTARRSSPFDPIMSTSSSASGGPTPVLSTPMTPTILDQPQQVDPGKVLAATSAKLPIKAKPPLPPKLIGSTSKPKATPQPRRSPSLAGTTSPRRSRTRPTRRHRSRSRSRRPLSGNSGRRGSRPKNHQRSPLPRHGHTSRTSRPSSTSPRRFTHPIYARSTMPRSNSPPTRAHRNRPPRGRTRTIQTTTRIDSLTNTGRHHSRLRFDSPHSLRLCSRPREHRDTQGHQRGLFDREPGVHIQAKARPIRPASKSRSPQPEPEPPQAFDESLEMKIPPSVDIPPVIGTRTRRRKTSTWWKTYMDGLDNYGEASVWRSKQNKSSLWIGSCRHYVLDPESTHGKIRNIPSNFAHQKSKHTSDDPWEYGFYLCLL